MGKGERQDSGSCSLTEAQRHGGRLEQTSSQTFDELQRMTRMTTDEAACPSSYARSLASPKCRTGGWAPSRAGQACFSTCLSARTCWALSPPPTRFINPLRIRPRNGFIGVLLQRGRSCGANGPPKGGTPNQAASCVSAVARGINKLNRAPRVGLEYPL